MVLCFAVAFGIAFLVLRCARPRMVYETDTKGKEKLDSWKLVGFSALIAVVVCLVGMFVSKGSSRGLNNSPRPLSSGSVNPYS